MLAVNTELALNFLDKEMATSKKHICAKLKIKNLLILKKKHKLLRV